MELHDYESSPLPEELVDNILQGILPGEDPSALFHAPHQHDPLQFLPSSDMGIISSPEDLLSSPDEHFVSSPEEDYGQGLGGGSSSGGEHASKKMRPTMLHMEWTPYSPPGKQFFPLCDHTGVEIRGVMDLQARIDKIDQPEHYSPADDAFILYRQNQFQLELDLMGILQSYNSPSAYPPTQFAVNTHGILVPVDGLFFHVYAIKQSNKKFADEELVELAQLGGPRAKKEYQNPELCSIQSGRAVFQRLQFRAATANNARATPDRPNPNQQYYRLVVTLVAKTHNTLCFVASKISPCLIVRGQNPGKFQATSKAETQREGSPSDAKSMKRPYTDIAQPSPEGHEGWKSDNNTRALFTGAKVGINTSSPQEALTVHGNILVTGDIVKPSDQRIKMNVEKVDPNSQLQNIENLKIYEYDVKALGSGGEQLHERGVLAQELQRIMPNAVKVVRGLTLADGTKLPELLVVQDRALLFETIGATQQLSKEMRSNREHVYLLTDNLNTHVRESRQVSRKITQFVEKVMTFVFNENTTDYVSDNPCLFITAYGDKSNYHMSVFGLGPAWTMYILGFFFPLLWFAGAFFIASLDRVKRTAGWVHAITFILWIIHICLTASLPMNYGTRVYFTIFFTMTLGVAVVSIFTIYWKRKKNIRRMQQSDSVQQLLQELQQQQQEEENEEQLQRQQHVVDMNYNSTSNNNNSNNNNSNNNNDNSNSKNNGGGSNNVNYYQQQAQAIQEQHEHAQPHPSHIPSKPLPRLPELQPMTA